MLKKLIMSAIILVALTGNGTPAPSPTRIIQQSPFIPIQSSRADWGY
jgi:hypothetical protein